MSDLSRVKKCFEADFRPRFFIVGGTMIQGTRIACSRIFCGSVISNRFIS
jgi:hypothetical protein